MVIPMLLFSHMRFSRSPLSAPLRAFGAVLVAVICVAIGYTLGSHRSAQAVVPAGEGHVINQGFVPPDVSDDADFATFWEVWRTVRAVYVDQPASEKNLYYGSIAGMVAGLNDPYSTYFTPEDAKAFDEQLAGSFFGIGAQLDMKDEQIVVVAPLPGTPADRAGIRTGDIIAAIDGISTEAMSIDEAVSNIRGEKGTAVVLGILREGAAELQDFSIVRDEITVDSVVYAMKDDHVAVITISMFNEDTSSLFAKAAENAVSEGATSIVLDLRNNPGGLLDSAIDLAGYWIPKGGTAVIEDVRGKKTNFPTYGSGSLKDIPTVVLVNGGSASAAEILAGALQDTGEAVVIGEQTFGKGSVQEYHDLPDGGAVKITVARWLTPLGRSIDKQGIAPDNVVPLTIEDVHAKRDTQFDAALDILQKE